MTHGSVVSSPLVVLLQQPAPSMNFSRGTWAPEVTLNVWGGPTHRARRLYFWTTFKFHVPLLKKPCTQPHILSLWHTGQEGPGPQYQSQLLPEFFDAWSPNFLGEAGDPRFSCLAEECSQASKTVLPLPWTSLEASLMAGLEVSPSLASTTPFST